MQGVGGGIGGLRRCWAQWSRAGCLNSSSKRGATVLGFMGGARVFSQSAAAASSPSSLLEKEEVTSRIIHLLKSTPFIDPSKVFSLFPFYRFRLFPEKMQVIKITLLRVQFFRFRLGLTTHGVGLQVSFSFFVFFLFFTPCQPPMRVLIWDSENCWDLNMDHVF